MEAFGFILGVLALLIFGYLVYVRVRSGKGTTLGTGGSTDGRKKPPGGVVDKE